MFRALASPALAVFLALALVMGGVARGHSAALLPAVDGFEVVICAEGGAVTIRLDAEGNPLPTQEGAHGFHCPDCLLAGANGLVPASALAIHGERAETRHASFEPAGLPATRRRALPEARGPPTELPA